MIEFIIIASVLLAMGFATFEAARWFSTQQVLSIALLEAARAGIVRHGYPPAIKAAFVEALAPLHPGPAKAQQPHPYPSTAMGVFKPDYRQAGPPWQIEILSPTPADFTHFADPALRRIGAPYPAINNHYLQEQHTRRGAAANRPAMGNQSPRTIYEANTLTLRLTYPLKPLAAGIPAILRLAGKHMSSPAGAIMAQGYLPLHREISLVMQTHPIAWPMPRTFRR